MIKRIFSVTLCLAMLLGCFSFNISAAEVEAVLGDVEYATFEEAVAAARNGDIIILKDNVTVEETVRIEDTLTIRSDEGYGIIGSAELVDSVFDISGSLTLVGVSVWDEPLCPSHVITLSGGTFNMRDGASVAGGVNVMAGTFNFQSGTLSDGNVYIEDDSCSFRMQGDASLDGMYINLASNAYIEITSALSGTGDINIIYGAVSSGDRVAALSGSASLSAEQLARFKVSSGDEEYTVMLNGSDVIADKPVGKTDVARIGDKGYPTLAEAFAEAAAADSATVVLTAVAVVDAPITVKGNVTLASDGNYTVYAGSEVNGSMFVIPGGSTLKISDSDNTITVSGRDNGAALFDVQGELKIDTSVIITGNVNSSETHNKGVVYVNGGSFSMSSGSISGNKSKTGTVYVNSGSFTMTGGSINNNTAVTAGGVYVAGGSFVLGGGVIYGNSGDGVWTAGSFTLSGSGSVYSSATYPGTVFLSNSASVKVKDGWKPSTPGAGYSNVISIAMTEPKLLYVVAEFEGTPAKDYFKMSERYEGKFALRVKDKKLVVSAADEMYTVYWGNNSYMTLEEAVAALPENTQVTLRIVGDTLVSAPVVIKKGMNITVTTDTNPAKLDEDYKVRTVKRAAEFTGEIFRVEKGATLTLAAAEEKSLVFDGENKKVNSAMLITAGGAVIGKGVEIKANNNKNSEKLAAPSVFTFGGGVYVEKGGSFSVNGGIISGNYASYGAGIYVNDGALGISDGEIKENSALYGAGVYLETSGADAGTRASLAMTGGKITANKADAVEAIKDSGVAGGVFITNGSSFVMSDGSVEKNTAARASGVCVGVNKHSKDIPVPEFILSDKASISTDNSVYLAIPEISVIKVTSALTSNTATSISIPEEMPQNMTLVVFEFADSEAAGETAAKKAFDAKRFVLDKEASEYFRVDISHGDKSVLVNVTGDYLPSRTKSGAHHNGLAAYETEKAEEGEEEIRTPIVYGPAVIRENSSVTTAYEFSYYPNLYKSISAYISVPFPEGTRIVMIDTTAEKPGYYYYEVSGEEEVVSAAEEENGKKLPDTVEIPLEQFLVMGSKDTYYKPYVNEDTSEKAVTHEKLLFVIDFTDIHLEENEIFEGKLSMVLNHYYSGNEEGERYDISGNVMISEFTVSTTSSSTLTLSTAEDGSFEVSYELSDDSAVLSHGKGVILFQTGGGTFPRGTVLADEKGNQYIAAGKSDVIVVPMPSNNGVIEKSGTLKLTLKNYYGTAIADGTIRCVIALSDDGKHYTVGAKYDAESEGIKFNLAAADEYAILVTAANGADKPYYDNYEALKDLTAIEITVMGLKNTEEVDSFNLALQKKQNGEYKTCALSELFNLSEEYGNEVILNTGKRSLELTSDIEALMGNEYKIVFKVGDAVEYVKVNVVKKK